ncbi:MULTISPECIES: hypothetical protein [Aeromicrobium]|uniref:DUF4760 domain-containing protein n=1 Tax=Aeromicrobium phoceense TaxID=2754045 RepID=A0A838XCK3_9ACTN|nr:MULTISPECIES: hypothetical protein [Aeromicrobium]MBA4608265.1 hypothetical protein [Aeromicrobium phoceense]
MDSAVLLPLATLVLGSVLTFTLEAIRHRRQRKESVQDARRLERSQAYVDYLECAHEAAHLLGRATPGCPNPLEDIAHSYWLVDSSVASRLRVIEVLGSEDVISRAKGMRTALVTFRRDLQSEEMTYWSEEYQDAYGLVVSARGAFIEAARSDLRQT